MDKSAPQMNEIAPQREKEIKMHFKGIKVL